MKGGSAVVSACPRVAKDKLREGLGALVTELQERAFDVHEYSDLERQNACNGLGLLHCSKLIEAVYKVAPEGRILMSELRSGLEEQIALHRYTRFNRTSYPDKVTRQSSRTCCVLDAFSQYCFC